MKEKCLEVVQYKRNHFAKKLKKGKRGYKKLNYAIFKVAFANFQLGYTY